jgi:hypothetical protein
LAIFMRLLVAPRAGNSDTWAENDGRSPTMAFAESISDLTSNRVGIRTDDFC